MKEDSDGLVIDEGNTFTGCIESTLRRMVMSGHPHWLSVIPSHSRIY